MPEKWDEEDDSSTPPSSPPAVATIARRSKFDDEEEEDSDVLESWDAAEDSEVEREKAKAAAERKAKADAEAALNKKTKKQRIEERQAEHRRLAEEDSDEESSEDEAERRERLRRTEQESDLKHAEDLFGNLGVSNRKVTTAANAVVVDAKDPATTVDLGALPLFDPKTKLQFEKLRDTLVPLVSGNSKKAHYIMFLQEFTKQIAKDLPSDQIKKIASSLTALSNEKLKEEKAADKGGKKSKAQKTKATLVASRNAATAVDVNAYDDYGDDDDFMWEDHLITVYPEIKCANERPTSEDYFNQLQSFHTSAVSKSQGEDQVKPVSISCKVQLTSHRAGWRFEGAGHTEVHHVGGRTLSIYFHNRRHWNCSTGVFQLAFEIGHKENLFNQRIQNMGL